MKNLKKYIKNTLMALAVFLMASFAYAQGLEVAANNFKDLVNIGAKAAYMLAFFAFFWFLAMYLLSKSDDDKTKNLKNLIMAVVVIFVMTSIWGIVSVLQKTVGADNNSAGESLDIPGLQI